MTWWSCASVGAVVVGLASCKGHPAAVAPTTSSADGGESPAAQVVDAMPEAGGPEAPVVKIAALESPTPITSAPEWPAKDPSKASEDRQGVMRLGYLRKGDVVEAKAAVVKRSNCPEGWYELLEGGYICGKYATTDMNAKELADAPHPPFTDGPLPYEYGLNLTTGTPLYRRKVTRAERNQYERSLAVGKTNAKTDPGTSPPPDHSEDTPWYAREGARKTVKLDDLHEAEGPVFERMVRGFYLALDKQMSFYAGKFWRTTHGLYAPGDHILVHKSTTEYEGVHVGDAEEKRKLPVGFITGLHARQYRFTDDDKARRGDHVDRFTIVGLTGKKKVVEDRNYYETIDGWWTRDVDGTMTRPGPPPADLASGEKWIDVNLSTQTLVAFEGDKAVYATLISSGRHDDKDASKDHRTQMGSFRIREKHISATMDDDSASDGPYSIEDVPWIMYFNKSYALHGAFWHSAFGHERSHGCVNLNPHDAKEIFTWAGPALPTGWHGVRATDNNPGTRVIVHD
jgi:signal peptidase I